MNQALKKILIKTKKQVFSEIIGNNSTKLKGEGYDFCELKEYEYGEDVKNIDWVISAKMQKPYVKVFYSQRELNVNIVCLLNGSSYFGTDIFKYEIITQIASALGFICVKQGNPFSSFIANENLEICTKKSKQIFNVNLMAEQLFNYEMIGKEIDYEKITKELFKSIKEKSLIFLLGDFFDIEKLDLKLLCQKHEILILIIRDKFEENPMELGNVSFIDPSNNKIFESILNKKSILEYEKKILENDHKLYAHLQDCNISFTKIYTSDNPIKKLIGVLK
jgi:uncharacterized protein (DUF58 family)